MNLVTALIIFTIYNQVTGAERLGPWSDRKHEEMLEEYFTLDKKQTWWEAAYSGCEEAGGRLVVDHSGLDENKLYSVMEEDKDYWVGAFETHTPWMWTETNEPLFQHKGETDTTVLTSDYTLQDNSAFSCFIKCRASSDTVGLQGRRCFCKIVDSELSKREDCVRCAGSYTEFCGGEHFISVYKIDLPASVKIIRKVNGDSNCGYIRYNDDDKVLKLGFQSCENNTAYSVCAGNDLSQSWTDNCDANLCITSDSNEPTDWVTSNAKCNLSKLTNETLLSLTTLLSRDYSEDDFWVGLRRQVEWRWINDKNLTVSTTTSSLTTTRESPSTVETTTFYPNTKVPTTSALTEQSPESTTHNISAAPTSQYKGRETTPHKSSALSEAGNRENIPALAGGGVAAVVVVLIVAVVILLWTKRTRRFCFKTQKSPESRIKFNKRNNETSSGHANPSYEVTTTSTSADYESETENQGNNSVYYNVPSGVTVNMENRNDNDYDIADVKAFPINRSTADDNDGDNDTPYINTATTTTSKVDKHVSSSHEGDYDSTDTTNTTTHISNVYNNVALDDNGDYDTCDKKTKTTTSDVYNYV